MITFEDAVLTARDVSIDNTLLAESGQDTMLVEVNTITPGRIEIGISRTHDLTGSGVLLHIEFTVVSRLISTTVSTALHFETFMFNEGSPSTETQDGSLTAYIVTPAAFTFDAVSEGAAIEVLIDTVKTNAAKTLKDSLLAVSYYVTGVLNPFVAKVFDVNDNKPGTVLASKVIDPVGGLSRLGSDGFTRFEDGRISLGITQDDTLFVAMELLDATRPSIGVNISLDPSRSWTFDELGGVTQWRRSSEFGITGNGGFMIRAVTGIMGDVTQFLPFERGMQDGEIGTEDLDFVVDVVLKRISAAGVSEVISGGDEVTRFLIDTVDGKAGGPDGIINLFDILFVVNRL